MRVFCLNLVIGVFVNGFLLCGVFVCGGFVSGFLSCGFFVMWVVCVFLCGLVGGGFFCGVFVMWGFCLWGFCHDSGPISLRIISFPV